MKRQALKEKRFRFWLRPCDAGDAGAIFAAVDESRARVGAWMDWLTPAYSVADAESWAAGAAADWEMGSRYEFVIIDWQDGAICGCCGLNRINQTDLVCNLGYWVRDSKTRQGAATEAVRLLRDFGIRLLGLNRLEIVVALGNEASRMLAEKSGAEYEGVQKMRLLVAGESHDAHMYALLADPDEPEYRPPRARPAL